MANTHFLNFWMVKYIGELTFVSYLDGQLEGKNVANCHEFTKFAYIFSLQIFSAYGSYLKFSRILCLQILLPPLKLIPQNYKL